MFCEVIIVYAASGDGLAGMFSSVSKRAIVLRSSRIRAGLSTVPPDFTDVRMVVSSARSSVTFFRRSSGSIWLSSRFLRIASFLFLLILDDNRNLGLGLCLDQYLGHYLVRRNHFGFLCQFGWWGCGVCGRR